MKATLKDWVKRSLVASGALSFAGRMRGPGVAILMFHSVMPDPRAHRDTLGPIIHSSQLFREQMEALAREYNPVSLDDVLLFVQGEKRLPRKPVVVTFDDGYADNAEFAAPILNEFGIPAAFYVTVDCVDKATPPWVARLRYAFHTTRKSTWAGLNGQPWPLADADERERAFDAASENCACLTGQVQDAFAAAVAEALNAGRMPDENRMMMTWDQARQVARQGHIVGSHTMTHPNMAHVKGDADLQQEFAQSKRRLEQELLSPAMHFSYPCPILQPHWTDRTVKVCRQLGYRTAVTTNSGPVRRGDDPLTLRRVPPAKSVEGLRWNLECTFLGRAM